MDVPLIVHVDDPLCPFVPEGYDGLLPWDDADGGDRGVSSSD